MARLNIRNLPDEILAAACLPEDPDVAPEQLAACVDKRYAARKPTNVVDELVAERRREAEAECLA